MTNPDPHIRPVNLRTDLPTLADLIELVFAPTMDESGRAAIREMRYMSRMGGWSDGAWALERDDAGHQDGLRVG